MSFKNTLRRVTFGKLEAIWQPVSHAALGENFEKLIVAYVQGGLPAIEQLLARMTLSGRVRADAYTALARYLMREDRDKAAWAARRAYDLDPKPYRLKWLIFRLYDAGEIGEAKALLDILPPDTSFSDSETRRVEQLRAEVAKPLARKPSNTDFKKTLGKIRLAPALKGKASGPSPQYIVTLTSYGERLTKTAPYIIASLLAQMEQPDRIILWVAHADGERIYNASANITAIYAELIAKGVEIRYCEDLKSYKKLIPALREFPEDILITADDDCLYPFDWFFKLKTTATENPGKIVCHRAHKIGVDKECRLLAYTAWHNFVSMDDIENSAEIFPTGVGGVLYPPHCFDERVTDDSLFMKLSPHGDDIWFWAMARLAGTECVIVKDGYLREVYLDKKWQQNSGNVLFIHNVNKGGNDKQFHDVIDYFPKLNDVLKKMETTYRYCYPQWTAKQIADEWDGKISMPIYHLRATEKAIPVAMDADKDHAPHLMVMLQSMLEHVSPDKTYHFYILQKGVYPHDMTALSAQVRKYPNCRVEFIDVSETFRDIPIYFSNGSDAMDIFKLLVPYLFGEYGKIIYINVAAFVNTDISELYEIDLRDKPLGACRDYVMNTFSSERDVRKKYSRPVFASGLVPFSANYFNSGVLVFNTKRFQEKISLKELLRTTVFYSKSFFKNAYLDKDVLNIIFHDCYHLLPETWNLQTPCSTLFRNKIVHFATTQVWNPGSAYSQNVKKDWWEYALKVFNSNVNNRDSGENYPTISNNENAVIYNSRRQIPDLKIEVVYNYIGIERDENKGIPLVYSLRSVKKFLKAPHKVTIFTDGGLPEFACQMVDRVVDSTKLGFPSSINDNTARSKDAYLIKNWFTHYAESDYLIYLNDEFMFSSEVGLEDFIENGKPLAAAKKMEIFPHIFPPFPSRYIWAISNSFYMLSKKIPDHFSPVIHEHFPQCYSREVFDKVYKNFSSEIEKSIGFSARRNDALVLQSVLGICLKSGEYIEKKMDKNEYAVIHKPGGFPKITGNMKFICFNNDWMPEYGALMDKVLATGLD